LDRGGTPTGPDLPGRMLKGIIFMGIDVDAVTEHVVFNA
jgi:hypothetical protein